MTQPKCTRENPKCPYHDPNWRRSKADEVPTLPEQNAERERDLPLLPRSSTDARGGAASEDHGKDALGG